MSTVEQTVPLSKTAAVARKSKRRPWLAIALFIGPAILFYTIFVVYPLLATIWYSFHTISAGGGQVNTTFVGLKNYIDLIDDSTFFLAVRNTLLWGIVGPVLEMVLATVLAFLVYFRVPLWRFYRVAWFTPILVSGVIIGIVFRWVFNVDWGLINVALRAVGLNALALNWLGRLDTPIWVVIFVHLWATFGFSFVLLLAGLSAIPHELVEAAYIDGANRARTIRHVMLPLLRPTLLTVLILSFLGKMHAFNVVWSLTNGGPLHYSETVATYMQKRAFSYTSLDLGYPAAMGVVWFGVTVVGVAIILQRMRRRASDLN